MARKIHPKIYSVVIDGKEFHIDGQIHQSTTKEWQLFEVVSGSYDCEQNEWIDTFRTKKDAINAAKELSK